MSAIASIVGSVLGLDGGSTTTTTVQAATATAPTILDSGTAALDAKQEAKKKAALAQGYQSTILTGSEGDTSTPTTTKATLG